MVFLCSFMSGHTLVPESRKRVRYSPSQRALFHIVMALFFPSATFSTANIRRIVTRRMLEIAIAVVSQIHADQTIQ
jgi:hypothetical protein